MDVWRWHFFCGCIFYSPEHFFNDKLIFWPEWRSGIDPGGSGSKSYYEKPGDQYFYFLKISKYFLRSSSYVKLMKKVNQMDFLRLDFLGIIIINKSPPYIYIF